MNPDFLDNPTETVHGHGDVKTMGDPDVQGAMEASSGLLSSNVCVVHPMMAEADIEAIHEDENFPNRYTEDMESIPMQWQFLNTSNVSIKGGRCSRIQRSSEISSQEASNNPYAAVFPRFCSEEVQLKTEEQVCSGARLLTSREQSEPVGALCLFEENQAAREKKQWEDVPMCGAVSPRVPTHVPNHGYGEDGLPGEEELHVVAPAVWKDFSLEGMETPAMHAEEPRMEQRNRLTFARVVRRCIGRVRRALSSAWRMTNVLVLGN